MVDASLVCTFLCFDRFSLTTYYTAQELLLRPSTDNNAGIGAVLLRAAAVPGLPLAGPELPASCWHLADARDAVLPSKARRCRLFWWLGRAE